MGNIKGTDYPCTAKCRDKQYTIYCPCDRNMLALSYHNIDPLQKDFKPSHFKRQNDEYHTHKKNVILTDEHKCVYDHLALNHRPNCTNFSCKFVRVNTPIVQPISVAKETVNKDVNLDEEKDNALKETFFDCIDSEKPAREIDKLNTSITVEKQSVNNDVKSAGLKNNQIEVL